MVPALQPMRLGSGQRPLPPMGWARPPCRLGSVGVVNVVVVDALSWSVGYCCKFNTYSNVGSTFSDKYNTRVIPYLED